MLVGITGLIGAGKTEVADIFRKGGAYVISADQIGKKVVKSHPLLLLRLARAFGPEILTPSGRLRRKKLGDLAFASLEKKKKLEKIIHPILLRELSLKSKEALKKRRLVVIDAALLVYWGWHKKVDFLILVHATEKIRLARLIKAGYGKKEALARSKSQLPFSLQKRCADFVIYNNGSRESLEAKVEKIRKRLA
jgi:dephospho-CoA kinase